MVNHSCGLQFGNKSLGGVANSLQQQQQQKNCSVEPENC